MDPDRLGGNHQPANRAINEIIKGTKRITPETAVELGAAFGTSAELWLSLETRYRLFWAQQSKSTETIATKSKLFSLLPIRDMQKRDWIPETIDAEKLTISVNRYLGIDSLDDSIALAVDFKCSPDKEPDYAAKVAWVKRAEHLAHSRECQPYKREELLKRLPEGRIFDK